MKRNHRKKQPKGKKRRSSGRQRILLIPSGEGVREISVSEAREARRLARYWNAVHHQLQTGDASRLQEFEGVQIKDAKGRKIPLLTDPKELDRLGSAGVLSFESLYVRGS